MKKKKNKRRQRPARPAPPPKAPSKLMTFARGTAEKLTTSPKVRRIYDSGVVYFLLAFLIPAAIMFLCFRREEIHPFGDNQMLVVDLWHQYYPFFQVLREKLMNGGSFLYSWDTGIGTNFLGLIAYYAMSPLNWLAVFFDDDHVRDALTYFLIAKIGFSGAFFSCFLRYTYRRKDFSIVVFSSMFALCSYMLGYYWNVMWFDTVAVFPLVMTGVVALCREGKWKLYTVSLALALITNYYIGYMVCIFTMIMFAAAAVIECGGIKEIFSRLWLIIRSTVIGIGLGGFILLPAYNALMLAYRLDKKLVFAVEWHEKWYKLITNLLSFNTPTDKEGLPNIACGMLAVTLFGVFLFSTGIKLKEKIMTTLALVIVGVSLNMKMLNYIWHGFHDTNQLPYRFAFIFSFVLAALAYRAYVAMLDKGITIWQLLLLAVGPAAVLIISVVNDRANGVFFGAYDYEKKSMYIAIAYVLIFVAVKLFPWKSPTWRRSVLNIALAATVFFELSRNAALGVQTVGHSNYSSYPANSSGVSYCLEAMEKKDNPLFCRTEITTNYSINDPALYGYRGISQFSSTANVSVTQLMKKLGLYGADNANRYYYRNATPVTNGFLGINYLISKGKTLDDSELFLDLDAYRDNAFLYINKYPLSLGFMVEPEIMIMDMSADNPFEFQNRLIKAATGVQEIFTPQPVQLATYNNVNVNKSSYGNYTYALEDASMTGSCTYDYAGITDSQLYGFLRCSTSDSAAALRNGEKTDANINIKSYPVVFPIGNCGDGDTGSVQFELKTDRSSGNYTLVVYALSRSAFETAYNALADEQFNITEFTDTKITGTVDAAKRGVLYFSIPYEKGWHIYVDGEETRTVKLMNAMLGAEIGSGHHEITLEYSPEGFKLGLLISGTALVLFIVWLLCDMGAKKKSKKVISAPLPVRKSKMDDISGAEVSRDLGEAGFRINEKPESNDSISGD